jgi:hypothetical protein
LRVSAGLSLPRRFWQDDSLPFFVTFLTFFPGKKGMTSLAGIVGEWTGFLALWHVAPDKAWRFRALDF